MSDGDSDRLWIDFGRKKEGEEGTKEGRKDENSFIAPRMRVSARGAPGPRHCLSHSTRRRKEGGKEGRKEGRRNSGQVQVQAVWLVWWRMDTVAAKQWRVEGAEGKEGGEGKGRGGRKAGRLCVVGACGVH